MDPSLIFDTWKTSFYIRYVEKLVSSVYSHSNMRCPTHLSVGQEMVPSIVSQYLTNTTLLLVHIQPALFIQGWFTSKFFDELHGLDSGCSGGRGGLCI